MKKKLLIMLALILCFSLSGCKYGDVAGTYQHTSLYQASTLKLKANGKFEFSAVKAGPTGGKDTFSGTFEVDGNKITYKFKDDLLEGNPVQTWTGTIKKDKYVTFRYMGAELRMNKN